MDTIVLFATLSLALSVPMVQGQTYDLTRPDTVFALDRRLAEISGLAWTPDGFLAAIEDEHGILYLLDPSTGRIHARQRFGQDRDYEGIAVHGDRVWVLESDGDLFTFRRGAEDRLVRHATPLSRRNDTEGLAVLPDGGLLLVCKEAPGADVDGRAAWRFDTTTNELSDRPVAVFPDAGFKPSGVAVHPETGAWFILSGNPAGLMIRSAEGLITHQMTLSHPRMPQPEGIAFAPDGTLYIASEGRSRGHLFRFKPLPDRP